MTTPDKVRPTAEEVREALANVDREGGFCGQEAVVLAAEVRALREELEKARGEAKAAKLDGHADGIFEALSMGLMLGMDRDKLSAIGSHYRGQAMAVRTLAALQKAGEAKP